MKWIDLIIVAVILVIVGLAIFAIRKAQKSGRKCIGCPEGGTCAEGCPGCGK